MTSGDVHPAPRSLRALVDPPNWLLFRGLTREKRHWGSFPERFAGTVRGRVLCLDLPGFGSEHTRPSPSSLAEITKDVRSRFERERGAAPWAVLGISLGGMLALDWCARYPGDFTHCVTINTSARPSNPFQRFRPTAAISLLAAMGDEARERAVLRRTTSLRGHALSVAVRAHVGWRREHPPTSAAIIAQVRAAMAFDLPPELRTPLLVLASSGDRLVAPSCSRQIARRLGAPLVMHEGGGHDLVLDAPAWICGAVHRWMAADAGYFA